MTPNEEKALEETVQRAKETLFEADGTLRGYGYFSKWWTLSVLFRTTTPQEQINPRDGLEFVSWRGALYVYDAPLAGALIEGPEPMNYFCDQVLCIAGALLLDATKGIADDRLRRYVFKSLSGDNPEFKVDGRATRNMFRDRAIWEWLMLPLIQQGFSPTRNVATRDSEKSECASSIVSKALERVDWSNEDNCYGWAPDHPDLLPATLLLNEALGVKDEALGWGLLSQMAAVAGSNESSQARGGDAMADTMNFMVAMIKGYPRDTVEVTLAAQMASVHVLTMRLANQLASSSTLKSLP